MPEHKNGGAGRSASKRSASESETSRAANESKRSAADAGRPSSGIPVRRKRNYLIGVRPLPGFAAPSADTIHDALNKMEDIEIIRRLRRTGFQGLSAVPLPGDHDIIVARMNEKRAESLRQSAPPHVAVEEDARLRTGQANVHLFFASPWSREVATPRGRQEIRFRVLGDGDRPLAGTGITLFGRGFSAQAISDASGVARLEIFDAEADIEDVHAVYVQPLADHWDCFVQEPMLDASEPNSVRVSPLPSSTAKPAGEKRAAWSLKAMGLDRLAAGLTGAGVKIALIDSGCDNTHPLLRHITRGVDLSGRGDSAKNWQRDEIGQGTHCAGIIAAAHDPSAGVSGIAPEAEIHVFKLAPGGRFSDLIEALDQCIERQIDIVHLGVATQQVSELVTHKIIEARFKGVACIAGAGDSGGLVHFPALVPGVLSVAAIGRLGEFPEGTHHGLTAIPELIAPSGIFVTNFSGSGPQIAVCAPGVAVISTVPGGGIAARDGTTTAAAHIAGFAAVILAHHPLFRSVYGSRNEQRVNALFELIRSSAVPPVFDSTRVGSGLPDLQRVPGMGASDVDAWNKAVQNFGAMAASGQSIGERLPGGFPRPDLAGAMTLMQLRASGLI